MALVPKNAPTFEAGEDGEVLDAEVTQGAATGTPTPAERVAAAAAKQAAEAKPTEAPAASAGTAVAPAKSTALAAPAKVMVNPLEALKDRIPVTYGSLKAIMVTNGNVALKDGKELLGTYVGLEILSYQDHWVCSPGGESNDEESQKYLKFSDDGKTERDSGEPLTKFVQLAIDAGYTQAKIVQRLIVVGALVYPGKDKKGAYMSELENEVVSIDLAPLSRANFLGYQATASFKASRGLITEQQACTVKLSAAVKTKGKNNWTDADFKTFDPAVDIIK